MKYYFFSVPTKIIIGCGSISCLAEEIIPFGKKVFLVTGCYAMRQKGILDSVIELLNNRGISVYLFDKVKPEPSCEIVDIGRSEIAKENSNVIVGLGGGSVIDVAKAIAGLAKVKGSTGLFLEEKQELPEPGIPFIAIPTTAGTGAEVSPNAVLINPQTRIKKSLRSKFLFAKTAIIDPELVIGCTPCVIAYSGIDALSHAIESFVSLLANPITDSLCKEAIRLNLKSLLKVFNDNRDLSSLVDLSYASLIAGIAFFNARLGAVHGIAHSLGARYNLPHGLVCGLLLPSVMEFNLDCAKEKYSYIASCFDEDEKDAGKAIFGIKRLLCKVGYPCGLKEMGVKESDFSIIAKESLSSSSLQANPKKVSEQDVVLILKNSQTLLTSTSDVDTI